MPLGLENFQPETFEQANPVAAGYAATLGMNQTALQNQLLQAQAQYAPQNAQAASQTAQAQAAQAQYSTQPQQLPLSQPGIAGTLAQISAAQRQNPQYFGGNGGPPSGSASPLTVSSGAAPSPLSQSLPTLQGGLSAPSPGAPTQQLTIPPSSLSNIGSTLVAGISAPAQQAVANVQLAQQRAQYYQNLIGNMSVQNAQKFSSSPEGQAAIASDPNVAAAFANKLGAGSGISISPQAVSAVQTLAQNKTTTQEFTPRQLQMLPFAKSLDLNMQQAAPLIQSIGSYTGAGGNVQYLRDKAAVAAGSPAPPAYQSLQQFEAKMPAITADIRNVLGDHPTDYQTAAIQSVLDAKEWDSNPTVTMQKFQSLINSAHSSLGALSQTKAQSVAGAQASAAAPALNLQQAAGQASNIRVRSPDGRTGTLPAGQLQFYLDRGYKEM